MVTVSPAESPHDQWGRVVAVLFPDGASVVGRTFLKDLLTFEGDLRV